jgi:hypothetical protein
METYDAQGIHRSATDVDQQSAVWLANLASGAGAETTLEPFAIHRVDVVAAFIELAGRRLDGLPFFDGSFTDAQGVTGRLAHGSTTVDATPGARSSADKNTIGLVILDAAGISAEGRSIEGLRRSGTHRAIVAVTRGAHPGLSPTNASAFREPYGTPVLQVSSEAEALLRGVAARDEAIRLVAHATRTPAEASNVVARVAGRDPDLPPLVVMTPRSGWWNCAAERGGGLACWLETIRVCAAARPVRTVIALASSGHELGHFGLDQFLARRRDLVKRATAWLHLGANIGAARGVPRLQTSGDDMERLATDAFSRAEAIVTARLPRGARPGGEARNIHDGGGRYVSLLGSGPFFHNAADRWPMASDVAAVARFARAFADLAVVFASNRERQPRRG